jgi:parvulin-like peptidyl-prolyl isomerase
MTMSVFLSVNGREVSVEQAVRHALFDQQGRRFLETLVEHELLRQHAQETGLAISADELQKAANEMRYERGLTERERTLEWVRAHGQTVASIEDQIELLLLRRKVANAIPEAEVVEYYRAHRDALEYVVLFSIRAEAETEATALRARLDAGEPFPVVASAWSRDATTRRAGGFVGRLRRAEMSDEIARAVFAAEVGSPIGPLRTEKGFGLFLVAARQVPTLEEESAGIRLMLFESLMARLRDAATVHCPPIDADFPVPEI